MGGLEFQSVTLGRQSGGVVLGSFAMPKGAILGIVGGRSGLGTQILDTIAGFKSLTFGSMLFGKDELHKQLPHARPLAMIFKEGNLFNQLTLLENVTLGIQGTLQLTEKDRQKVAFIMEYVGLRGVSNRYPETLCQGLVKRASLARALVTEKPLLLFDDPFSDLDGQERPVFERLLRDVHGKFGLTLVVAVPSMDQVKGLASHVVVCEGEQVTYEGSLAQVLAAEGKHA